MTISEKVAYIKGLADGMKIDEATNEGKLTLAILDVLTDIADELDLIDESIEEIEEDLDDIDDAIEELEDELYGCDDYDFDGDGLYEITCRKCNNSMEIDMSVLEDGSINCPNCGEKIEFDIDFLDSDSDSDSSDDS